MPTSSLPLAGSCLDVISNVTSHEQAGVDLCVKAGRDTQLFLGCKLKRGNPEPIITWLLDGTPISEINGSYTQLSDGTLLIEDILLPGDVLSSGGWDISGLYTCVAVNIAGTAHASSYVFPFGGKQPIYRSPVMILIMYYIHDSQIFLRTPLQGTTIHNTWLCITSFIQ